MGLRRCVGRAGDGSTCMRRAWRVWRESVAEEEGAEEEEEGKNGARRSRKRTVEAVFGLVVSIRETVSAAARL